MKNNTDVPFYEFNALTFFLAFDENHHAYIKLHELVSEMLLSDKELFKSYILKKFKEQEDKLISEDMPDDIKKDVLEVFILSHVEGISNAVNIFNRQTLVTIATIIESMLDEFFLCIFCSSPVKMYEYIQSDDEGKVKGKIDIKDIINSPSRTELLLSLAKQAASKAMQGERKSTIKRLKKLTIGEEFSKEISDNIIELEKTRNEIVHELSDLKVSFEDVKKAFETGLKLAEYFEEVAKQLGIPVDEISQNNDGVS